MSFLRTSARLYQTFHQRLVTCVGYKQLIEMVTKKQCILPTFKSRARYRRGYQSVTNRGEVNIVCVLSASFAQV